ncbi:universal stress protein [Neolewinella lacunae]|uniref:Universal stress protein n=1 Tax=Neolewinella lacunae TaxID=1517758 RepID=A0A923T9C6_9BACT|nr:universal stress protein [Neolewinella lacunae]MBC6995426.1 universal stress protein [Neolewinella lacunae]MDN3633831.1 universal stress protein [Neolewinella lacunae]
MSAIRSILVPVDFSEIAAASYRYALQLADHLSASVHLLHCLPAMTDASVHAHLLLDVTQVQQAQAEERLDAFLAAGVSDLTPNLNAPPVVACSVTGLGLWEGIDQYLSTFPTDLIVMGTHGVHDGWDRLFGTNAAFLAGKVQVPILILPATATFQPLKSICFATALRESDLTGTRRLHHALSAFAPTFNYLHVHHPENGQSPEALDLFRRAFEQPNGGVGATFTTVFNEDVTDGIFNYLENNAHDLLVMIKLPRKGWARWFSHRETLESAGITSLPLLVISQTYALEPVG